MNRFTFDEMTASDKARELGIDNTPPAWARQNIVALVQNILDPLREAFGKPIYVTSGYRCPRLNAAVGGVANSNHMKGLAADIRATGKYLIDREGNRRLYDLARSLRLPVKELLWEKGGSWIHISLDPAKL